MPAEGVLAESLSRVEHKVDLLLDMLATLTGPGKSGMFLLTPVGSEEHVCPVCTQPVRYLIDIMNKVVSRKCGCATGKQALDLGAFAAPTVIPRLEVADGNAEQEDRNDSSRRGGPRRR